MTDKITLYGLPYSRSARCRWTLLELGLEFEEINNQSLLHTDELRVLQPQGKMPALVVDGISLFESAAICTHLCDLHPDRELIAKTGTRERALHMQWTSFAQSEIEGYLWHNAKHISFYPEDERVPQIIEPNTKEIRSGLQVLDNTLSSQPYLTGGTFSVTDIIVGWTINWARRMELIEGLPALMAYNKDQLAMPNCPFNPE